MLSRPHAGWSDFELDGMTSGYGLSYLDDIAFEWLDQAIRGLETRKPFCVEGELEPGYFLCTVSLFNCHIVVEDGCSDDDDSDVTFFVSPTNMMEFCRNLYHDVSKNIDEWVCFYWGKDSKDPDVPKWRNELEGKLTRLKELIDETESKRFDGYRWL